jgi:phosphoribosylanthranilate isomerase
MWVKICGVRDEATAERICQLSPDAIGLNFYSGSPRRVSRDIATRIADLTGDAVQRVGVFVNQSASEIEDLVGICRLNAIQLHGDESPAQISTIAKRLPGIRIYRAWRMDGESLAGLGEHLVDCHTAGVVPVGCLIDARVKGSYGGTGQVVPWAALEREYQRDAWPPLILAGGLTEDNVTAAIRAVRPWGVDVASGVESAPGVKDLELVRRFLKNARNA